MNPPLKYYCQPHLFVSNFPRQRVIRGYIMFSTSLLLQSLAISFAGKQDFAHFPNCARAAATMAVRAASALAAGQASWAMVGLPQPTPLARPSNTTTTPQSST